MKKLKKFISRIRELENWAALLMAGAAMMFTACSSSEDSIIEQPTPESPAAAKTYTMTVQASKGGDAMTRALSLGTDGDNKTIINATWATGEKVYVFNGTKNKALGDYLEAKTAGETATLGGNLTGTVEVDDELYLGFPQLDEYYTGQDGTLATIASTYDYALGVATVTEVTDGKITAENHDMGGPVQFENQQAIVKFTLLNKADNSAINATSLTIEAKDASSNDMLIQTFNFASSEITFGPITITPSTSSPATNVIYAALSPDCPNVSYESYDYTLTATDGDGNTYTYSKSDVTFEYGKYYEITVKMFDQSKIIDLSGVKASELPNATLTLKSGDVLTGTLDGSTEDGKVKIEIAAGATVTLHNAHINGYHYSDTECRWAGINCLGDATIVLSGENSVTNFNRYYPAILAAHNDTGSGTEYTLTIRGSGKLTATGTIFGAGIGGGSDSDIGNIPCGNICIESGTIIANGGSGSAAIGGGSSTSCGNITISGGTVTATADAENGGAGIGSGKYGGSGASCGDITISGTANVTAMGGDDAAGIGSGWAMNNTTNECGKISISGACKVTATGGKGGAGIGTGYQATCGDISINGGIITAQGGSKAAGIGCGDQNVINGGRMSECGAITIVDGGNFTSVTAIRGQDALRPIGHSNYNRDWNTCGNIIFGDKTVYTAGREPNYNITGIRDLNFTETTTDLGGGEDYTKNTWVLTKK